jgi:hypothetical protein
VALVVAQVSLDLPALAIYGGLLDLQVGKGLRLDRELVSKAVALGLPSFFSAEPSRFASWR